MKSLLTSLTVSVIILGCRARPQDQSDAKEATYRGFKYESIEFKLTGSDGKPIADIPLGKSTAAEVAAVRQEALLACPQQ